MGLGAWGAIIGVVISSLASSCSALGNVLLKWSHEDNLSKPPEEQKPAYMRCHWYGIYPLYVLGGLMDLASFGFAPMSLLAPTSSFTIVINTFFARFILGEKMTNMAYVGSAIIIVGAVTCTIFGSKESHQRSADELKDLFVRPGYLHYQGVNCALLVLSMMLSIVLIPLYYGDVDEQLAKEREARSAALPDSSIVDDDLSATTTEQPPNTSDSTRRPSPTIQSEESKLGSEDVVVEMRDMDSSTATEAGMTEAQKEAAEAKARTEEINRLTMEEYQRRRDKSLLVYGVWAVCYSYVTCGFGTFTNTLMKCTVEMISLSLSGTAQTSDPIFYLFIGMTLLSAIFQLTSCVYMMCTFPAVFIVPIYQCMFIVSLIVGGSTYFQEFDQLNTLSIVMFSLGCLICFVGIVVMCALDLNEEKNAESEPEGDVVQPPCEQQNEHSA